MLTRAIFSEGCKSVAAGMNPMDLRRGINAAVETVVGNLKSRATMISTTSEIAQVGTMLRARAASQVRNNESTAYGVGLQQPTAPLLC